MIDLEGKWLNCRACYLFSPFTALQTFNQIAHVTTAMDTSLQPLTLPFPAVHLASASKWRPTTNLICLLCCLTRLPFCVCHVALLDYFLQRQLSPKVFNHRFGATNFGLFFLLSLFRFSVLKISIDNQALPRFVWVFLFLFLFWFLFFLHFP